MTLARFFRRAPRRPYGWHDEPDEIDVVAAVHDYAQASVAADEDVLARSRESLRATFLATRAPRSVGSAGAAETPSERLAPRRFAPRRFAPRRFALGAAVVALLAVGGVGGVLAESGPGEPFYRFRLDVEALTLPAPGTLQRLDADLARAQARLDELDRAASTGNWQAAAAAADAYADVLTAVANEPGVSAQAVRLRLTTQLETLDRVRAASSGSTQAALGRAIERVRACLQAPETSPGPTSPASDDVPNGGPGLLRAGPHGTELHRTVQRAKPGRFGRAEGVGRTSGVIRVSGRARSERIGRPDASGWG